MGFNDSIRDLVGRVFGWRAGSGIYSGGVLPVLFVRNQWSPRCAWVWYVTLACLTFRKPRTQTKYDHPVSCTLLSLLAARSM